MEVTSFNEQTTSKFCELHKETVFICVCVLWESAVLFSEEIDEVDNGERG